MLKTTVTHSLAKGQHGQFYQCLPSTAVKNDDAFTRQTCDLNKYSCVELSIVLEESSEFSVNMSPVVDQEAYGADRSQLNFW